MDLKAQYAAIRRDIDGAIARVLDHTGFIMGPEVADFEHSFARFCGARHCVGVSSGTSALELALRALRVGPGDEVITVAHTFIATAEAISAVGARPIFVDIDPLSYTMDPTCLEEAISPATRAVIPVHIYGHPAPMETINQIADRHAIAVLEDAAQAHGATWSNRSCGALSLGGCFSFYPGKNLGAYGDAGAVVTDDDQLASQVRLLRNHGRHSKYLHEIVGLGERLDTLQAAVLGAKLPYLASWIDARRRLAARYSAQLANSGLDLPQTTPGANPAWHLYVIRTPQRDALAQWLLHRGISSGVHYPVPLHLQPAYAHLGYTRGALPVTEMVADSCLSLPLYPELQEAEQDRVVTAVREFLQTVEA